MLAAGSLLIGGIIAAATCLGSLLGAEKIITVPLPFIAIGGLISSAYAYVKNWPPIKVAAFTAIPMAALAGELIGRLTFELL